MSVRKISHRPKRLERRRASSSHRKQTGIIKRFFKRISRHITFLIPLLFHASRRLEKSNGAGYISEMTAADLKNLLNVSRGLQGIMTCVAVAAIRSERIARRRYTAPK